MSLPLLAPRLLCRPPPRSPPVLPLLRRTLISSTSPAFTSSPTFGFAFDIDGVLLHSSQPHPTASSALKLLNAHNIPFLLLTNGGGHPESHRVRELSSRLSVPLSVSQFVQSHTPFRAHATPDTVLVIGGTGQSCRTVATEYGFSDVLIPSDFVAAFPGVVPFSEVEGHKQHARPRSDVVGKRIGAAFVFNDPRDWACDIQVILDVLLARNGEVGTRRRVSEVLKDGHVPVYFSNPDLWWANEYEHARLGQGGFRAALEGVWARVTDGQGLKAETIGKPWRKTYEFAEDTLMEWAGERGSNGLKRVYMVGDNPASDIKGANEFRSARGTEWVSVLVKSGVYKEGDFDSGAKKIVDNVGEAVNWALQHEGAQV